MATKCDVTDLGWITLEFTVSQPAGHWPTADRSGWLCHSFTSIIYRASAGQACIYMCMQQPEGLHEACHAHATTHSSMYCKCVCAASWGKPAYNLHQSTYPLLLAQQCEPQHTLARSTVLPLERDVPARTILEMHAMCVLHVCMMVSQSLGAKERCPESCPLTRWSHIALTVHIALGTFLGEITCSSRAPARVSCSQCCVASHTRA